MYAVQYLGNKLLNQMTQQTQDIDKYWVDVSCLL